MTSKSEQQQFEGMDKKRYQIQVGKGKGAYKTRWTFDTLAQAWAYYRMLHTHSGHKKRLLDTQRGLVWHRVIT